MSSGFRRSQGLKPLTFFFKTGFTLVELLVTLAIMGFIIVFIAPTLRNMVMNARVNMQADRLVHSLNFARQTALNQNISVQVCPLGAFGSTTCGSNWGAGWIVVTQPATGSPVLLSSSQAFSTEPIVSATGVTGVTFNARGIATTQSNFKVCDSRGASFALSAVVFATGFVQSGPTRGTAVWDGSALTCP